MNVWFISQGRGFDAENANDYVRAPSEDRIPTHIRINYLAQGDAIILYHNQGIYGIGFYNSSRYEPYSDTGIQSRIVYLERIKFRRPIPKYCISQQLSDAQPQRGAPININFNVNQGYCFFANETMLNIVLEHCNDESTKNAIIEKVNYSKEHFESVSYEHLTRQQPYPLMLNANSGGRQNNYVGALPTELNPYKETTLKDERDGYEYRAIEIGGKTWLAENFRYQNQTIRIKGIFIVNGSRVNTEDYGYLYTWDAAQAACPPGWHLPTDEEWKKLFEDTYNAEMLINYYDFDCPKAGIRNPDHTIGTCGFCSFNEVTAFWSATQKPHNATEANRWSMSARTNSFNPYFMNKNFAFSVRYVKDTENED